MCFCVRKIWSISCSSAFAYCSSYLLHSLFLRRYVRDLCYMVGWYIENNATSIKENNSTILICVCMHFMRTNKLMTKKPKTNKWLLTDCHETYVNHWIILILCFDPELLLYLIMFLLWRAASAGLGFLQFCNLNSYRSMLILGLSLCIGLSVPQYFHDDLLLPKNDRLHTGSTWVCI